MKATKTPATKTPATPTTTEFKMPETKASDFKMVIPTGEAEKMQAVTAAKVETAKQDAAKATTAQPAVIAPEPAKPAAQPDPKTVNCSTCGLTFPTYLTESVKGLIPGNIVITCLVCELGTDENKVRGNAKPGWKKAMLIHDAANKQESNATPTPKEPDMKATDNKPTTPAAAKPVAAPVTAKPAAQPATPASKPAATTVGNATEAQQLQARAIYLAVFEKQHQNLSAILPQLAFLKTPSIASEVKCAMAAMKQAQDFINNEPLAVFTNALINTKALAKEDRPNRLFQVGDKGKLAPRYVVKYPTLTPKQANELTVVTVDGAKLTMTAEGLKDNVVIPALHITKLGGNKSASVKPAVDKAANHAKLVEQAKADAAAVKPAAKPVVTLAPVAKSDNKPASAPKAESKPTTPAKPEAKPVVATKADARSAAMAAKPTPAKKK